MPALVVFDTCTRAQYYEDVHRLLAAPSGTLLRYDYQEKYFSADAFAFMSGLREQDCPVDIVLFYGQFEDYQKAGDDPLGRVLDPAAAILIPTRYAKLRNVSIEERLGGSDQSRTVLHFHMELMGFPNPDSPAIRTLMDMLAAKKELPFEKWVAMAPDEADLTEFLREDTKLWSKVVDRLAAPPSQFHGDIFWRIDGVSKEGWNGLQAISPQAREGNRFGDVEFGYDYVLSPLTTYRLNISNFIPTGTSTDLPRGTAIALTGADAEPLTIPEPKKVFRRNASSYFKIKTKAISDVAPHLMSITLSTEVPDGKSPYTPGSVVDLPFKASISGYRVTVMLVLAVLGVAFGGAGVSNLLKEGPPIWQSVAIVIGLLLLFFAGVAYTGKMKLPGVKD